MVILIFEASKFLKIVSNSILDVLPCSKFPPCNSYLVRDCLTTTSRTLIFAPSGLMLLPFLQGITVFCIGVVEPLVRIFSTSPVLIWPVRSKGTSASLASSCSCFLLTLACPHVRSPRVNKLGLCAIALVQRALQLLYLGRQDGQLLLGVAHIHGGNLLSAGIADGLRATASAEEACPLHVVQLFHFQLCI
ncbi:hypothetical protein LSM04_000591 [Trypanosoma melophagium]|uniref:uncharacterized protein n=1 Tax=Trypanosoma melophagium TaxID=715481 RepID=UPI003519D892|nr:hypothetical protein LSM04_000591 [Trypanosoma melophagium]